MQALGLLMVSPDRTVPGQELHSCVTSILSKKLGWDATQTSHAAIELEWAFKELGIYDESVFAYFDDGQVSRKFQTIRSFMFISLRN